MNANKTTELTHAGQCLDIYLFSAIDIHEQYTVPTIAAVVEVAKRKCWRRPNSKAIRDLTSWVSCQDNTGKAVRAAARLMKGVIRTTPTAEDIEQVTRNYAAYVVTCALLRLSRERRGCDK